MGEGVQGDLVKARLALVEEHVRFENDHDLESVLGTFGATPRYDDEPNGEHHLGLEGIHRYYEDLMRALPDLHIDVKRRYVTDDALTLEVEISGTHLGPWRGLPATGRRVRFPLCAIYTFDGDKLAGERIYYDRATVFRQVGIFHDPETALGRALTALTHPVTIGRALARKALASRSR
jgi:steroid delta-isomerase-like uncharacterized protein